MLSTVHRSVATPGSTSGPCAGNEITEPYGGCPRPRGSLGWRSRLTPASQSVLATFKSTPRQRTAVKKELPDERCRRDGAGVPESVTVAMAKLAGEAAGRSACAGCGHRAAGGGCGSVAARSRWNVRVWTRRTVRAHCLHGYRCRGWRRRRRGGRDTAGAASGVRPGRRSGDQRSHAPPGRVRIMVHDVRVMSTVSVPGPTSCRVLEPGGAVKQLTGGRGRTPR